MDLDKAIVSKVLIDDRCLFLGINSTEKIGIEDGVGFVNLEKLKAEMEDIKSEYLDQYNDMIKIAIMHHYPHYYQSHLEDGDCNNKMESNTIGNFDLKNWEKVKAIFNEYNIDIVLTGHIHGSQVSLNSTCEEGEDIIYYSAIGSIGMNFNSELNKILDFVDILKLGERQKEEYEELKKKIEKNKITLSSSNRHNTYGIITIGEDKIEEQHYKYIMDEGEDKCLAWYEKCRR